MVDLKNNHVALHEKGHYWSWCGCCGFTVMCGTCGMNMCGGSGFLDKERTVECPDCDSAYQLWQRPDNDQLSKLETYARGLIEELYSRAWMVDQLRETAEKMGHADVFAEIEATSHRNWEAEQTAKQAAFDEMIAEWTDENRAKEEERMRRLEHVCHMFHQALGLVQEYQDITPGSIRAVIEGMLDEPVWDKLDEDTKSTFRTIMQSTRLH